MRKLVKIEKKKRIAFPNKIYNYLDPERVYIPFPNDVLMDSEITRVLVNQIIYEDTKYSYTSPISGHVLGVINKTINNENMQCIDIKNDYKEKKVSKKSILKVDNINSLKQLLSKLHLFSLESKLIEGNYIILNGIVDEPYSYNEQYYLNKYCDEILETLDFLGHLIENSSVIIGLKNIDSTNINSFLSIIGTYSNMKIRLLDDHYLLEKDYFLCKELNILQEKAIILKPSEIYELYMVIKYNKKLDTRIISIVDINKCKCYMINTKYNVALDDILTKFKISYSNKKIIKNGLMTGIEVQPESEIIMADANTYFILNDDKYVAEECIRCGKCYQICPLKINPKFHMDTQKKSNNCIDCGLCSYICPARINLRLYLKGEKNE